MTDKEKPGTTPPSSSENAAQRPRLRLGNISRRPSNVDKDLPKEGRGHPANVDNGHLPTSSNVDKNTARPPRPSNVDNFQYEDAGIDGAELAFPISGNQQAGGAASKPKGPSKEILRRIRASKKTIKDRNTALDQNVGSTLSRKSPSKFARSDLTTVSKTTSAQYQKRGRLLINRYKRELNIPQDYGDFDAKGFVHWLLSLKPTYRPSTWRVYRQAAYHTLQSKPDDDIEEALDMIDNDIMEGDDAVGVQNDLEEGELKQSAYKTSAMKEKRFPKADFDRYLAYLQYKSRSKHAPALTDMLIASVYCGLRPIEWRATSFETSRDPETNERFAWLYVMNAKTTNERGNGLVRTLNLSDVPAPVLNAIKRTSERGLSWYESGKYDDMQGQLSQLIYKIGEEIYPRRKKHFCLYSCRHQFIANMKTLMSPEEVAALSGHVVTKTAKQNYGQRQSAWSIEDINAHAKPTMEEVTTVRKTASLYSDRIEKLKLAGVVHGNESSTWPT